MLRAVTSLMVAGFSLFAVMPSTTNYELQSYGFGSGGTANSSTSNYALEGITGEVSGQPSSTANYGVKPGYIATQQANVPIITLSNPNNYYDKLSFAIDAQNNPSDALYALQVSTSSNFSSNVNYVQADNTLSPTLTTGDYQTYAAWSASGDMIIGLSPNTSYYIRAKATQGKYTESQYGPASSSATVGQQLSYCLYTNANCAAGGSSVSFGAMTAGTVASNTSIGIDFSTNADLGGNVYVSSLNGGLKSSSAGYTLSSSTANLSTATEGYGGQVASASQTSGGPFSSVSPYNGTSNSVGALSPTIATIFSSSGAVNGGVGTVTLKALPSNSSPEASDYSDILTFIAAASF